MRVMKQSQRIHIFKGGRRLSGNGIERNYSADDLKTCAANYSAETFKAPLVLGHPTSGAPAYGWVEKLEAEGDNLFAQVSAIDPLLENAVAVGAYKNLSASFYLEDSPFNPKPGALYLRHVGVLGAEPPAIKDLEPLRFAENDATDFVFFEEENLMTEKETPVENVEIEKNSPSTAEKNDSLEKTSDFAEKIAALNADLEKTKAEKENVAKELAELKANLRKGEHVAFADSLIKEGKLPPSSAQVLIETLEVLSVANADFAEGDAKQPLKDAFCAMLKNLNPAVPLGEVASDFAEKDEKPLDLASLSGNEALKLYQDDRAAFLKAAGRAI